MLQVGPLPSASRPLPFTSRPRSVHPHRTYWSALGMPQGPIGNRAGPIGNPRSTGLGRSITEQCPRGRSVRGALERRISMVGGDSGSYRQPSTGANHHGLRRLEGSVQASLLASPGLSWLLPASPGVSSLERRISMVGGDSGSDRVPSTGANHHGLRRL